jgi:hypothetical protein
MSSHKYFFREDATHLGQSELLTCVDIKEISKVGAESVLCARLPAHTGWLEGKAWRSFQ